MPVSLPGSFARVFGYALFHVPVCEGIPARLAGEGLAVSPSGVGVEWVYTLPKAPA